MRLLALAALAAATAFAHPAVAADCEIGRQADHARASAADGLKSGRFDAFVDLTGADLLAFIKAADEQFNVGIPDDGHIEEGMVIVVDGGIHFFGFAKGCQEGHVQLPAMPGKTSGPAAPALLPHGLRVI